MTNQQKYTNARAAIAAVMLARVGCIGFALFYLWRLDFMGVGLMVGLFWGVGWLLPVTGK